VKNLSQENQMRKWGLAVTAFYLLVVVVLVVPGVHTIMLERNGRDLFGFYADLSREWMAWLWIGILGGGQAMLLFLSVDSSHRKLKPRQHVLLSGAVAAILIALLTQAAAYSLLGGLFGDSGPMWKSLLEGPGRVIVLLLALWLVWGVLFFLYAKGAPIATTRLLDWLMKGSVLELLIAVPCHVIARRRGDCSAPLLSGYGIATGLAIMLLSFGPSVLFLYKKRFDRYTKPDDNGVA
jgi:hypothetical protein